MGTIDIALDKNLLEIGLPLYVGWEFQKFPHMVIFGSTGSGKTYALRLILGKIALHIPNVQLTVCDFKGDDDFSFLNGSPCFYRYMDCQKGLDHFVQLLQSRQSGADKTMHQFLVFDEYAAFLTSMDKKQSEAAKQQMSTLLMLGRSFNLHVIVSQQRIDATYFANARDNFSVVIGLGRLSKESVEMMFSDFKDVIDRNKPRGEGNCLVGGDLAEIVVPRVVDTARLEQVIVQKCRPGCGRAGPEV